MKEPTQAQLAAFLLRAKSIYGWKNLDSNARLRLVEHAVSELKAIAALLQDEPSSATVPSDAELDALIPEPEEKGESWCDEYGYERWEYNFNQAQVRQSMRAVLALAAPAAPLSDDTLRYLWNGASSGTKFEVWIDEARHALRAAPAVPIDMVLHCPKCGLQHIDKADEIDPYPTPEKDVAHWSNPSHRSHLCHGCGHIWRPADVPTNGVAAVKTKGKADSSPDVPANKNEFVVNKVVSKELDLPVGTRIRLAGAPAVKAEPVSWQERTYWDEGEDAPKWGAWYQCQKPTDEQLQRAKNLGIKREYRSLYTGPAAQSADAVDAKRYRHMRNNAQFLDRNGPGLYWYLPRFLQGDSGQKLDKALDDAIAQSAKIEDRHSFEWTGQHSFEQTAPAQSADARDANRYRKLRIQHWWSSKLFVVKGGRDRIKLGTACPSEELLDELVDALPGPEDLHPS